MAENNSGKRAVRKRVVSMEGNKKYKRNYASELASEKFRKETGDTAEESAMRVKRGVHTQKDQKDRDAEYNEKFAKYGGATASKPKCTAQSVNLGTSDNPLYLVRQVYQSATPISRRIIQPSAEVAADLKLGKARPKDIFRDIYGLIGVQFVIDSSKKPMNKQQIRLTQTNLGKVFLDSAGEKMKVDSKKLAAAWCKSVKDVDATNESVNLSIYYVNKDLIEKPAASKSKAASNKMTVAQYLSYIKDKREDVFAKAKAIRGDIVDATHEDLTPDEIARNEQIIKKNSKRVSNEEKLQHMNDAFFRELQKNNPDYDKLERLENSMSKLGKAATGEDTNKLIGNNHNESNKLFMSALQGGNGADRLLHKLIKGGIKTQSGESLYDAAFNSYPANVGSNSEKNAWIRQNVPAEVLKNAYKKAAAHTDDAKANANNKKAQNEKKSKDKSNEHIVNALTPKYGY